VLAARRAAACFRCPQTPSASLSALALGLPLIWGPVQCSPRSARLLRPTHARLPPRAADAVGWRGASPLVKLIWGPVRCSRALRTRCAAPMPPERFAHAALLRCPQTPSAGMAPLGASLPFIWGPVQCSPRSVRLRRTNPRAASAARRRRRRLAWHLSAPGSLCLAPPVQGGYCTACPAGVGRWRLGPAQEGVANSVRSGRKQRYRMSSCAAGRPSRYRRTPRTSTQ